MKARTLALIALATSGSAPTAALAAEPLQPGLWEVTATTELPGMASPPPTQQTECLTQSQVDAEPAPGLAQGACKVTDVRRAGDRTSWKVDCGPVGKGAGEITVRSGTEYDGWMTLETGGTVVRTTLRARRVGKC